jgi:hypothetical protein
MRKMSKSTFLRIFLKNSSKFKCNLYTWIRIRIRIQQLKLMQIRNPNPACMTNLGECCSAGGVAEESWLVHGLAPVQLVYVVPNELEG